MWWGFYAFQSLFKSSYVLDTGCIMIILGCIDRGEGLPCMSGKGLLNQQWNYGRGRESTSKRNSQVLSEEYEKKQYIKGYTMDTIHPNQLCSNDISCLVQAERSPHGGAGA